MRIVEGINIKEGINIDIGIEVKEGIDISLSEGLIVSNGVQTALSSGIWSGAFQTLTVAAASTYYRLDKTSIAQGDLPSGIEENNDCSFTNNSGRDRKIEYTLVSVVGNVNDVCGLALGSDEFGSDAVILADTAMTRTYINPGRPSTYTTKGTYIWKNGGTVFPMHANFTGANDLSWGSSKQKIEFLD